MRIRRASISVGLGLSLMAGVLTSVVFSAAPAQASMTGLPTLATAQPIGFNDRVSAAVRSDDTLYLGGDFTQAGRTTGAGAFADTQQQGHQAIRAGSPQFAKGTQNAAIFASVYVDNYADDGFFGWFVGGDFTSVGGHPRTNFAAIDFNSGGHVGKVVAEWAPSFNGSVNALAVKPASGGRNAILYVGGTFTSVTIGGTTTPRTRIAAFDITTKALLNWAPAISQDVKAIAVSGDRVYVGGGFSAVTPVGGVSTDRGKVAAFAADDTGTLLPWAPSVGDWNVWTLAAVDDTVYIGGDFTQVTPVGGSSALTRSKMAAIAGDDTGTVLPWAPQFAGGDVHTISAVDSAGFAGGRPALIVGGGFTGLTPVGAGTSTTRDRIAALGVDDTGTLLPWAPSFDASVFSTSVSRQFHACPGGGSCVYVGGNFAQAGSVVGNANQARARIAVVSLDDTGTLRPWSPGVSGVASGATTRVWTVSAAPLHGNADKTVFLGGEFTLAGMTPRTRLAALDAQGELTSWAPSVTGGEVRALATRGDQIYVGGTFTGVTDVANTSQTRNRLAAFGPSGVLNAAWNPNVPSGNVYALAADDTRVFVGGNFVSIASTGQRYLAAIARSSGTLVAWGPGVRGTPTVSSLSISGGRLYVGGTFTEFSQGGVQARNGAASILLDDTGTLTTWNPNVTGGAVNSISVSGPKAYIAGAFTTVGGQSRPRLAAVSTDDTGSLLALNVSPDNTVNGAAYAGDRLVIGGAFSQVGGQTRRLAATIDDTGTGSVNAAIDSSNDIDMVTVTGGQVILGGSYNASLGGVSIGNVAYGPRAPTDVTATATQGGVPLDGALDLSWTASWSGTFPIQGYRIEMSSDSGATWSTAVANTGCLGDLGPDRCGLYADPSRSHSITGLTNGTPYTFRVSALTVLGSNASTASTPVQPIATPGVIRGAQTQLASPAGVLRDSTGRLYAANTGGTAVTVYAPGAEGNVAPAARLARSASISGAPVGLSWGANGSVWVSYTDCHLVRFPALAPNATGDFSAEWVVNASALGSGTCKGMAASPVSGELAFVRGSNSANSIITVASSAGGSSGSPSSWSDNVSALRIISGLTWSYLLSATSSGDLIVGDDTASVTIPRLANGILGSSVMPLQRITNMYWARQGIQRSDGSIVVTDDSQAGGIVLNVFAPEASGAATPIAVVNGFTPASTTNLQGVALSADELTAYVTSSSNAIAWITGLPALQPPSPPTPPTPPAPAPVPGDPPSAPREVSAVAADASAVVRWAAPSSPGSFPVSSYQVTASPGGGGCMTGALTCTVGNLINGTTYTFTVKALNGAGWSAASAPSDPVTPRATPRPTITIMISGTRSARTIEITGSTRGIEPGSRVTPWIRKPGAEQAQAGRPQRVDDEGGFTWSRRVRADGTVRAYVTWSDIRSNVVRLPAGR